MTKLHHHPVREGHTPGNENAHWQVGAKEAKEPAPETEKKDSGNSAQAQRARLQAALRIGSITTLEARRDLDILMPASRVKELRNLGEPIMTLWDYQPTDCGRLHRIARYVLTGGGK